MPGIGTQNIQHHADGRGLAGAIAAEKAEDAAVRHREAETIHGGEITEPLHDLVKNQSCHRLIPRCEHCSSITGSGDGSRFVAKNVREDRAQIDQTEDHDDGHYGANREQHGGDDLEQSEGDG